MTAISDDRPLREVPDRGRLIGAVSFGTLAVLGGLHLAALTNAADLGWSRASDLLGGALVLAFNLLTVVAFLRRPRASARSDSRVAHVAAMVATCSTLLMPFLLGQRASTPVAAAADVLQLAGLAWSLWALHTLGRSFSVLAEARAIVDRGPYCWIRHPLYVGEVIAMAGVVLHGLSIAALALLATLIGLQAFRASREEAVLSGALPGYAEYQQRTARLFPGVF